MESKKRCKKAQMAAFILIGVILLIGASLATYIFYISKKAPSEGYALENLPESLDKLSLDMLITSCIKKTSDPQLIKIAKYGGTINPKPNEYRTYYKERYRYLCRQASGYTRCVNSMLTREGMQDELEQKIAAEMAACVGPALRFYTDRGYDIDAGEVSTRVIIATDDVNVIITYPIAASKGNSKMAVSDYSVKFNYPLGKMYDLAMEIMNGENSNGYFSQEDWMYRHGVEILIQKHRPYPDIIYSISKMEWNKRTPFIFNFALQGYDKLPELAGLASFGASGQAASGAIARSNAYDQDLGCCYSSKDGNCFENGEKNSCSDKSMEWRRGSCQQSGFKCGPISDSRFDNRSGLCYGARCFSCMNTTYADGDALDDPSSYTGTVMRHGESACVYEGPAGKGLDAVGSRHYKYVCMDGKVLVEECADYRDEVCVEEKNDIDGKELRRAVCRPNRWQDCHLIDEQAECEDKSKRDCYWDTIQDSFVLGSPSDQEPWPDTPYEKRHCVPNVPPGLRFWNTLEAMQVCGWANNYYECAAPGCVQEWTDFDAAFCAKQGDCGIYRNYLGKLPTMALSNLFPGAGQLPGIGTQDFGGGFVSAPNQVTSGLFEYVLPSEDNFRIPFYKNMDEQPAYPAQRGQVQVTPEMFVHNSPNDYSLIGIMTFVQEFMQWGIDRMNNMEGEIDDLLFHGDPIDWSAMGLSMCNAWMPATSATDCEKCNGNPYRPCTEYKCRSLGMYCNYEEIEGIGKCTSYGTSTIGRPVVKFNGQITSGYTLKSASLASAETSYLGKEIKEPITSDYTFQIKTNRETQCMLTLVPGASFGLNPPFPGTSIDYSFKKEHNLTIPYMTRESLSILTLPLELLSMISFNPDQLWSSLQGIVNSIINYIGGIADDCHDCNPLSTDCSDAMLIALSRDDCDDMDDIKDQTQNTFKSLSDTWNNDIKPQVDKWMGVAQKNAIDEILNYAATQKKYHAFIKCSDRGGNENDADLDFMRFRVNPKYIPVPEMPDAAPAITATIPENWTDETAEADGTKQVYLFIDQLSECAYDTSSKEFVYMQNKFGCMKSAYAGGAGGYMCNTSISFAQLINPAAPLYFKCMDHPEHFETFSFRLEPGDDFSGPSSVRWIAPSAEGEPGVVIIKRPGVINQSKPVISVPTTSVKFFLEFMRPENDHEKAIECRYAADPGQLSSSSAMLVDPATGNNECNNCTALLGSTGTDYYVSCHFKAAPRHEGTALQYVLKEGQAAPAEG